MVLVDGGPLYATVRKQVIRAHSDHAAKYAADNDYRMLSLRTVVSQQLDQHCKQQTILGAFHVHES
tara:strand:- start:965 stop:1162 length:198 start_codon:yes stop_codon:yes gene_type:complete